MHRAVQTLGVDAFLRQEAPLLAAAFAIAEVFYKFGSFAIECLAFLVTWYALSFLASRIAPVGAGADRQERGDSPGV